jgi:dihydrofolate reductase
VELVYYAKRLVMNPAKPRISLISALGRRTRAIGRGGDLIWKLSNDHARFRHLTQGHPVIMGRKTWESLPERYRPLPGRTNFVVTRSAMYAAPGATVSPSLTSAIESATNVPGSDEVFIIGGGQLYAEAFPLADRLYLTLVDDDTPGDVYFPAYGIFTKVIEEESFEGTPSYSFVTLER